jgi:hypothetical protein
MAGKTRPATQNKQRFISILSAEDFPKLQLLENLPLFKPGLLDSFSKAISKTNRVLEMDQHT